VETLIVILLVALIAAVLLIGLRIAKPQQAPAVQTPTTVVAPPIEIGPIIDAVKAGVDKDGIAAAVRVAVEAEVRKTAQEALVRNNEQAAQQASERLETHGATIDNQTRILLQPFEAQVKALTAQVAALQETYANEKGTIETLATQLGGLQETTTSLRNALKSPTARGSWGENQLRNVIRIAGMENYCDYTEQFTGTENERNQRPDAVINLPSGGRIAVDSKAPLNAYLRMQDATDPATQDAELKQHARDMRAHAKALADKKYWDQFGHDTPDFVVMFVPGEGFVADAMKADTTLLADALQGRVLIASPVNLIALLLTIAKGWQSHKLNEQAEVVAKLGSELYERVGNVLEEVLKMGRAIGTTNTAYNDMVASLEGRLLVTLRRFKELGVVQENTPVKELSPVDKSPRPLTSPEAQKLDGGPKELES
jgi:DNA recombination protein RmuC